MKLLTIEFSDGTIRIHETEKITVDSGHGEPAIIFEDPDSAWVYYEKSIRCYSLRDLT